MSPEQGRTEGWTKLGAVQGTPKTQKEVPIVESLQSR